MSVSGDRGLHWSTALDTKGLYMGANRAKGIIAGLMKNISAMDVFAGIALSAGIAFHKISKMAYNFSKDFEHSMTEVSTISDAVTKDFEGMSDELIRMSQTTPESALGLSDALYQIISAGHDGAQAMDILRTSADLAIAGVTDTQVAADGITYVMNAFGEAAGNAENIAAKMFTTVRLGKTRMEELAPAVSMVAGLWAQAGGSFDDMMATIAEGVKKLPIDIMTTGIRGIITAIISPSEQAKETIKELGIEFDAATLKSKGFKYILDQMWQAVGNNEDKMEKLSAIFPNVRGLIGALAIEGEGFTKTLDEMSKGTDRYRAAVKKMSDDTTNQIKLLMNNLTAKFKPWGDKLLRVVGDAVGNMNSILDGTKGTLKEFVDNWEDVISAMSQGRSQISDMADRYEELSKKTKLSRDETVELESITRALSIAIPSLVSAFEQEKSSIEILTIVKDDLLRRDQKILEMRTSIAKASYEMLLSQQKLNELQEDENSKEIARLDEIIKKREEDITSYKKYKQFKQEFLESLVYGMISPTNPETPIMQSFSGGNALTKEEQQKIKENERNYRIQQRMFRPNDLMRDWAKALGKTDFEGVRQEYNSLIESGKSADEVYKILTDRVRANTKEFEIDQTKRLNLTQKEILGNEQLALEIETARIAYENLQKTVDGLNDSEKEQFEQQISNLQKSFKDKSLGVEVYKERLNNLKELLKDYPDLVKKVNNALENIKPKAPPPSGGGGKKTPAFVGPPEPADKDTTDIGKYYDNILVKYRTFEEQKDAIRDEFAQLREQAELRFGEDQEQAEIERLDLAEQTELKKVELAEQRYNEEQELINKRKDLETRFGFDIKKLNSELLKDTKSMNADELKAWIEKLTEIADYVKDKYPELYKVVFGELNKAVQLQFDNSRKKLEELATAIQRVGSFISEFDSEIGSVVSGIANIVKGISDIKLSTTLTGDFTGMVGIFSASIGIMKTLTSSTNKALEAIDKSVEKLTKNMEKLSIATDRAMGTEKYSAMLAEYKATKEAIVQTNIDIYKLTALLFANAFGQTGGAKETKKLLDDAYKRLDELEQLEFEQFKKLKEYFTGTTPEQIADAIASGYEDGFSSAKVSSKTFNDIMKNQLINTFKATIVTKALEGFYDKWAELSADADGFTEEDAKVMKEYWQAASETMGEEWEKVVEFAKSLNIDLSDIILDESINTLSDNIADSITQGIMEGKDAIDIFTDTFEMAMKTMLIDVFKDEIIMESVKKWMVDNKKDLASGSLSPEKLAGFKETLMKIITDGENTFKNIGEIAKGLGLGDLFKNDNAMSGLSGAISSITEDTAGLLAGQLGNIQVNVIKSTNSISVISNTLMEISESNIMIAEHTKANPLMLKRLESIDSKLSNELNLRAVGG